MTQAPVSSFGVRRNQIEELDGPDDYDVELASPASLFGSHINMIPLQSAVQSTRLFYGARFFNQAMPMVGAEAPLVQNLDPTDPDGASFDNKFGAFAGATRYGKNDPEAVVEKVDTGKIVLRRADGKRAEVDLYSSFPFNRKTSIHQTALVKPGDKVLPGQVLTKSNFTDDKGNLALGLNARIGLVPYKGHSMDDAVVVSESFAKRLQSEHNDMHAVDFRKGLRGGREHFTSLYPTVFTRDQLKKMDDDGVIQPGTVVQPGDPLILATRPKIVSSNTQAAGKLSKTLREARADASTTWDAKVPGEVTDVVKTSRGAKVMVRSIRPSELADKIVLRSGQKGTISLILPDEHMPRTVDGKPLDMALNHLGLPSRANDSLIYELLLGKIARKTGKPFILPSFTPNRENWYDVVEKLLTENGVGKTEEVFDPQSGKKLGQPITVGEGYVLKLHHTGESKSSSRGQGSYDADMQPQKGGGDSAQAKRLSGLESTVMLSSGAYANLREGATLRGQKNDEFWRAVRAGHAPRAPGRPFVWDKFRMILAGAGINTRALPGGRIRVGPFTDRDLDEHKPIELQNGEIVDPYTLEPVSGGLFDTALVGGNKWGKITLPEPIPNPSMEDSLRQLMGLTKKEFREVLAGRAPLPARA
jgi:DNA-directed RNA polymerase subunit beta